MTCITNLPTIYERDCKDTDEGLKTRKQLQENDKKKILTSRAVLNYVFICPCFGDQTIHYLAFKLHCITHDFFIIKAAMERSQMAVKLCEVIQIINSTLYVLWNLIILTFLHSSFTLGVIFLCRSRFRSNYDRLNRQQQKTIFCEGKVTSITERSE